MLFSPDCRARKTVSSDINNSKHPKMSLVKLCLAGIDILLYMIHMFAYNFLICTYMFHIGLFRMG